MLFSSTCSIVSALISLPSLEAGPVRRQSLITVNLGGRHIKCLMIYPVVIFANKNQIPEKSTKIATILLLPFVKIDRITLL